jgi:hypothetical protein
VTRRFAFVAITLLGACIDLDEPPPSPSVMYIADRGANRVTRFDGVTGEYLGELAMNDRPSCVRPGPDGALYVASFGDSEVTRIDPTTGETLGLFYKDTNILEEPVELLFRGSELVVLGNDTNNAIVIDASGTMIHDVGYPDMRGAHDFVFGDDDLLYVATEHDVSTNSTMQVWDVASGTQLGTFGSLDQIANASGIALVDGALLVTDFERGTLLRFDGHVPTVLATGLKHPVALELGLDGMLYIADETGVVRYTRKGVRDGMFIAKGPHFVSARSLTITAR